ncbi:MAG: Ppx/GppA family phosphatase [OCS116 cluster bacterium]|nr:Ppx/GppA family phosphatase [OCS116 cluster bacterium]
MYGALDLGTNNCRLLLARPQRRGFRVIDSFSRIIRLGEGLGKNSKLSDQAMDRTIDALKVCSEKMAYRGVHKSRLIATEACRRAENGAEFIHRVHAETGLKLEIIEQQTEAKLAVAGCAALLDERSNYALVFDIGGGSSELVLVEILPKAAADDPAEDDHSHIIEKSPFHPDYRIIDWTSLPIGVVTLSEKFGGTNVTHKLMDQMIEYVDAFLAPFEAKHQISQKITKEKIHLLGTSGTVTTVAGIHLKLKQYDRRRIDGYWLESSLSLGVTDMLIDMEFEGRANHPCIGPERADLVLAGCAIFNAIYKRWPAERTRVADRGLREGILTNLMSSDLADNQRTE